MKNFHQSFFIVATTAFVVRIIIYFDYYFFTVTPKLTRTMGTATLTVHHYIFGLLLILLGHAFRKRQNSNLIILIGIGIVVEEWTVLTTNLGIQHPVRYFSGADIPLGLLIFTGIYLIFSVLKKK